jgi:hypothetical protein
MLRRRRIVPDYPKPRWELISTTTKSEYTDEDYDLLPIGYYSLTYRVRVKDSDGNVSDFSNITPAVKGSEINSEQNPAIPITLAEESFPSTYRLARCYPNPANPETMIEYELPEPGYVQLEVYNLNGRLVKTLVANDLPAGRYTATWRGFNSRNSNVASGIYIYRLKVRDANGSTAFDQARKVLLMK